MLTKQSAKLIGVFVILFILGLLLSSKVFFAAASVVLLFLLIALILEPPRDVEIKLKEISGNVFFTNDYIDLTFEVTVNNGIGTVACIQEPPAEFELVEGNNLKVFWKGIGKRTFTMSYKLKCCKEGVHILPKIMWESHHLLGLCQGSEGKSGELIEVTVKSPIRNNTVRQIVSSLRLKNITKLGVVSTDFKELRDYVFGDPVGAVNWKATASRISSGINWPLVTEYEVEKKQSLMLFLDASQDMEVGTDTINAFEYAKQVAQALSWAFISEGFRVGMCIYNSDTQPLYPDIGKRQIYRISKQLATAEISYNGSEGLVGAVQKCKGYLTKYEASSVVITRLDSASAKSLMEGIRMIKGVSSNKRVNPLVIKLNVFGHESVPSIGLYERNAAKMVSMLHKSIEDQLRSARVTLVSWNPFEDSFYTALSKARR